MPNTIDKELESLKADEPKLLDIFKASPFDDKMDCDEKLTENIFYKYLYVDDAYQEYEKRLKETIKDNVKNNSIILMSGYAGNGKTTFIKTFINNNQAFSHHYLTYDERSMNESSANTDDEVLNLVKRYLRNQRETIENTIAFIIANQNTLKDNELISDKLYKYLNDETPINKDSIRNITIEFDYKDTFTCFFCHLFLNLQENKMKIIYFDNLDIVKMEFLSSKFLTSFHDALINANVLRKIDVFAKKRISINNFRFIFCLRDANEAIVNSHIKSRVNFNVVPFRIFFESTYYQNVIEKRVQFLDKIFDTKSLFSEMSLESLKELFIRQVKDKYFHEVFLPLFNFDYRTTVTAFLDIVTKDEKLIGNLKEKNLYGERGHLLFGLVKYALKENSLSKYLEEKVPLKGYCYIDRVLLTTVINGSNYNRNRQDTKKQRPESANSYALEYCIRDLEKFYSIKEILDSIARCFLYHENDWAHLLTIYNKNLKLETKNTFIDEFIHKYRNKNQEEYESELKEIKIRVNPAGFTFIKYILPHFEFYSNLVHNENPLFIDRLEISNSPSRFGFENVIDNVIRLVKSHIKSMETFFNEKFIKVTTVDDFYTSKYCFRHLRGENIARESGYFHSTRTITSHIAYIEDFRHETLSRFSSEDVEVLKRINRILIEKISAYVEMLKKSIDEKGKNDFVSDFEDAINLIAKSDYSNFSIWIKKK